MARDFYPMFSFVLKKRSVSETVNYYFFLPETDFYCTLHFEFPFHTYLDVFIHAKRNYVVREPLEPKSFQHKYVHFALLWRT